MQACWTVCIEGWCSTCATTIPNGWNWQHSARNHGQANLLLTDALDNLHMPVSPPEQSSHNALQSLFLQQSQFSAALPDARLTGKMLLSLRNILQQCFHALALRAVEIKPRMALSLGHGSGPKLHELLD